MSALAAAGAGCGGGDDGGLPDDAVAKVGDTVLTEADLERRLRGERASAATRAIGSVTYDPPDYTACIAEKQKEATSRKGASNGTDLKKECEQGYDEFQDAVLQALIRTEWVRQAADREGIEVGEAAAREAAELSKDRGFSSEAAYREYLKAAGMSEGDFVARARLDELTAKVTQNLEHDAPEPSDQDVRDYYQGHKEQFQAKELRAYRVLISKTRSKAGKGQAALERGQSWKSVVREYSTDTFISRLGGKVIYAFLDDRPITRHIFRARGGEIAGPFKVRGGWQVFEAGDTKPARQRPLREVRSEILDTLRDEAKEQANVDFIESYRSQTVCAPRYRVSDCSNAPKNKSGDTGSR